ncbi:MAG: sigma-54-dependent transcriptional regulator [Desulfobacterales bacterium]
MDKILVVDDDRNLLKVIKLRLEAENYQVDTATDAETAMAKARNEGFDLALVDLKLIGRNGIELMGDLHQFDPELPIIILTAHGTIKSAVEAMSKGAFSYLTKPFDYQEFLLQTQKCLEKRKLSREVKKLRNIVEEKYGFDNLIGKSRKMKRVLMQVAQAAKTDSAVFITGESGTGKELIARNLQLASSRAEGPFIAINCAAIPENLLESELFGYRKGAFTDAHQNKKGLFAQAHGGTFFLDEISEMSLNMQAKLLRVVEEKTVQPIGARTPVKVDARILAASNKNLEEEVQKGKFREDLFYRIHVIVIHLPPLRERKEDIPLLAGHFLDKYSRQVDKKISGFSPSASRKLLHHHWPGNVRELENSVESAVAMADKSVITEDLILQMHPSADEGLKPLKDAKNDFEKDYLIQLISITRGNITEAAKLAGKYRADLYELLKKYNLNPADFRKKG